MCDLEVAASSARSRRVTSASTTAAASRVRSCQRELLQGHPSTLERARVVLVGLIGQPDEDSPCDLLPPLVEGGVHLLRGPGDRPRDATTGQVSSE